jgi:CopG family transcriptional regulator, nickel-responsive regulator
MSNVVRFGISIESELLEKFDEHIKRKSYSNRSEAIRDLIRDTIVAEEWATDQETIGTITIVYDHHTRELVQTLIHLQHAFEGDIKAVLHIHMDHHNCLEVLVIKGEGRIVKTFADKLISTRGIKHGKLTMSTTGGLL